MSPASNSRSRPPPNPPRHGPPKSRRKPRSPRPPRSPEPGSPRCSCPSCPSSWRPRPAKRQSCLKNRSYPCSLILNLLCYCLRYIFEFDLSTCFTIYLYSGTPPESSCPVTHCLEPAHDLREHDRIRRPSAPTPCTLFPVPCTLLSMSLFNPAPDSAFTP